MASSYLVQFDTPQQQKTTTANIMLSTATTMVLYSSRRNESLSFQSDSMSQQQRKHQQSPLCPIDHNKYFEESSIPTAPSRSSNPTGGGPLVTSDTFNQSHGCIHSPRALELVDDCCLRFVRASGFQTFSMDPSNTITMEWNTRNVLMLWMNDKFSLIIV